MYNLSRHTSYTPIVSSGSHCLAPWEFAVEDLCLTVLEEHLMPELRTSVNAHDRTCFAIQEILQELNRQRILQTEGASGSSSAHASSSSATAAAAVSSHARSGAGSDNANNNSNNNNAVAAKVKVSHGPMPQELRSFLAARNLLDATETFWTTNYELTTTKGLDDRWIYYVGLPFQMWIGRWARKLAAYSHSAFAKVSQSHILAIFAVVTSCLHPPSILSQLFS